MRFALAFALALGLAVMSGAAQQITILTNGRNLQIPINHGLPDKPLGFTFCRLRYENIRRARKSGWGDDYPQADYNFMVRLAELTRTTISRWNNGYPGFANVTAMDPDLFRCPYLRMQNAANYDFTPEETARMHDYLLKGGFLWIDDNWDPDFEYIRPNLMRILPGATIVDLPVEHPMFSILYRVNPLPQIPSLGSWQRTRQDSEIGPSTVHYYGVFDDHDRLVVLVSMNSDVSDSWEREGDNQELLRDLCGEGLCAGCERGRLGHDPLRSPARIFEFVEMPRWQPVGSLYERCFLFLSAFPRDAVGGQRRVQLRPRDDKMTRRTLFAGGRVRSSITVS